MTDAELAKAITVVPDRLYYVVVRVIPYAREGVVWVDAETPYNYWPFFLDFGPLSTGNLYRFCRSLHAALTDRAHAGKRVFVFSGSHAAKRANAMYMTAAYTLLYMGRGPEEALRPFAGAAPPVPPWHDASPGADPFGLTTLDVLRGIARARACRFFSFEDGCFNLEEYEHYERVEQGDLNWIAEGRFLAFAGPHDARTATPEGYHTTAVDDLLPYFKKRGVAAVVRLNKKYYDERRFRGVGIEHHDMYYLDGSNPPEHILQRFLATCERTPGERRGSGAVVVVVWRW
jgi:cell division cycle 14